MSRSKVTAKPVGKAQIPDQNNKKVQQNVLASCKLVSHEEVHVSS